MPNLFSETEKPECEAKKKGANGRPPLILSRRQIRLIAPGTVPIAAAAWRAEAAARTADPGGARGGSAAPSAEVALDCRVKPGNDEIGEHPE